MAAPKKSTKKPDDGFSADERAAMRERAQELKRAKNGADGESDVLAKIAEMKGDDLAFAERIHALVKEHAPTLVARTWYGMPAYAKNGNVVCFFQSAGKFKARFATLGFSDKAMLDDGDMWPIYFALKAMTPAVEKRIVELITKAVG